MLTYEFHRGGPLTLFLIPASPLCDTETLYLNTYLRIISVTVRADRNNLFPTELHVDLQLRRTAVGIAWSNT